MKKLRCTKFFSLLVFMPLFIYITSTAFSQWNKTWSSSWVTEIGYFNNLAFISTGYGIMISTDKGNNWSSSNTGLPNKAATAFGYADGVYYVGIADYGLYKSTNAGISWTSCNLPGFICDIKEHNNSIYIGFNDFSEASNACHGIYFSDDKGANFTNITNNANSSFGQIGHVWAIDFNSQYLFNASEGGIYRTSNNGQTWESLFEGDELEDEYIDSRELIVINNTVLWSTSSSLFYSTNNGDYWNRCQTDESWKFSKFNNIIFKKSYNKLEYSADEGRTWINYSDDFTDLDLNMENFSIGIIDNNVCISTQNGLYYKALPALNVVDDNNSDNPKFYYNKINDNICLKNTNNIIVSVSIYNTSTDLVLRINDNCTNINANRLNSGIYFIEYVYNGKYCYDKINITK